MLTVFVLIGFCHCTLFAFIVFYLLQIELSHEVTITITFTGLCLAIQHNSSSASSFCTFQTHYKLIWFSIPGPNTTESLGGNTTDFLRVKVRPSLISYAHIFIHIVIFLGQNVQRLWLRFASSLLSILSTSKYSPVDELKIWKLLKMFKRCPI